MDDEDTCPGISLVHPLHPRSKSLKKALPFFLLMGNVVGLSGEAAEEHDKSTSPLVTTSTTQIGSLRGLGTNIEDADLQDLHTLAKLKCWSTIERYATTYDSIQHTTLTAGNAPLHTAISHHAPLSVVHALVLANPPSVALPNKFGNTPLHFCAWKNKSTDAVQVAQFLLEYHPQSAKVVNKTGNQLLLK